MQEIAQLTPYRIGLATSVRPSPSLSGTMHSPGPGLSYVKSWTVLRRMAIIVAESKKGKWDRRRLRCAPSERAREGTANCSLRPPKLADLGTRRSEIEFPVLERFHRKSSQRRCPAITANVVAPLYATFRSRRQGQTAVSRNQIQNSENERRISHVRTHS
jgi:hypothetical protein